MGSISLLVEDSTVAVLCFAAKGEKRKESRGIWVWDDVMMTEFKKRSIIFSSRTVSLLSSVCPSARHVGIVLPPSATGGNLSDAATATVFLLFGVLFRVNGHRRFYPTGRNSE